MNYGTVTPEPIIFSIHNFFTVPDYWIIPTQKSRLCLRLSVLIEGPTNWKILVSDM
jgi:hypothetical protein